MLGREERNPSSLRSPPLLSVRDSLDAKEKEVGLRAGLREMLSNKGLSVIVDVPQVFQNSHSEGSLCFADVGFITSVALDDVDDLF